MCLFAGPATSQEVDEQDQEVQIDEIIVTANKRETNLQNLGASVSAVSEKRIVEQGLDSLIDYATFVPGLAFSEEENGSPYGQVVTIRGVANGRRGSAINDSTASNTTAYYLDEYVVQPPDPKLFDVNRIEVLKGPQGTLFGVSAMGGALRVILNEPDTNGFAAKYDVYGSTIDEGGNSFGGNGMLNVPVIEDKLAVRVVASYRNRGGWIDWAPPPLDPSISDITIEDLLVRPDIATGVRTPNVVQNANTEESVTGRIALKWTPNDRVSIVPSFMFQDRVAAIGNFRDRQLEADYVQERFIEESREEIFSFVGVTGEFVLGDWKVLGETDLTVVLGETERESHAITDHTLDSGVRFGFNQDGTYPSTLALGNISKLTVGTSEIRLHGQSDKLDWIIGALHLTDEVDFFNIWQGRQWNANADNGNLIDQRDDCFLCVQAIRDYEQTSFFGDVIYNITDAFYVNAGVRFDDQDQRSNQFAVGSRGGRTQDALPLDDPEVNSNAQRRTENSLLEDGTSPRFGFGYQLSDDVLFYASAANAHRIGAPGRRNGNPDCIDALARAGLSQFEDGTIFTDEIWTYDVGMKSYFRDRSVLLNVSAYHSDWTDLQQRVSLNFFNPACTNVANVNIGEASSDGVDVEFVAIINEALEISASVGYNKTRLEEPPPGAVFNKGDRVGGVPDWTAALTFDYSRPLGGAMEGYLRGAWQYRDDILGPNLASQTDPFTFHEGFDTVRLIAGLRAEDWEISLFINNLTNTIGDTGGRQMTRARGKIVNKVTTIQPRTIGIRFSKDVSFFD